MKLLMKLPSVDGSDRIVVEKDTIEELRTEFKSFRNENKLSAEDIRNSVPVVLMENKYVGRFSYHGRFWDGNNNEIKLLLNKPFPGIVAVKNFT